MLYPINVRNKRTFSGKGIYIGRGSPLGNPFQMKGDAAEERERVINEYRLWLWRKIKTRDTTVLKALESLLGIARKEELNLICFCAPLRCHGEVIRSCLIWMDKGC